MEDKNESVGTENDSPKESNDKSVGTKKSWRVAAAGLMAGAAFTPKNIINSTDFKDNDKNVAPVVESIGDLNANYVPPIEEVSQEQIIPMTESSANVSIEETGMVILGNPDYSFTIGSPLGATDSKDPNVSYPYALPEGGFLDLGGVKVKVTYNSGYFSEVGFLNFPPQGGTPKVGEVLPYIWLLPSEAYGRGYKALPYAASLPGALEKDVYIDGRDGASYVVMPMITAGNAMSILSPETYVDSSGEKKVVAGIPEGFSIDSNNVLGKDTGYVTWVVGKMTKSSGEDFNLEVLGVVKNSNGGSGIYVERENLPQDVIEKCGMN